MKKIVMLMTVCLVLVTGIECIAENELDKILRIQDYAYITTTRSYSSYSNDRYLVIEAVYFSLEAALQVASEAWENRGTHNTEDREEIMPPPVIYKIERVGLKDIEFIDTKKELIQRRWQVKK